jgi:predicted DsbA family dithiol-disulfide isomerase
MAIWGLAFYLLIAAVYRLLPSQMFRFIMIGAGVEITLVWLMIAREIACLFCLANAVVMALLLLLFIPRRSAWQALAICLISFIASNYLIARENPPISAAQPVMAGSSIVARINGQAITLADLEGGIAAELYDMRSKIFRLKRDRLELLIRQTLAEQQGIQIEDAGQPSSPGDDLKGDPLKRESRRLLIDTLQRQPGIDQYLERPSLPYTNISIGNSPSKGPIDAPVTVIEFSDYLCPACKKTHPISNQIKEMYPGQIRWVFKDFPLKRHKGAEILAEAARCAGEQNKFWEFQDLLFGAKEHPDGAVLGQFARSLDLNIDQFRQCVETAKYAQDVINDKQDAANAGVSATPSFIINGQLNRGSMPLDLFKKRIDEALNQRNP